MDKKMDESDKIIKEKKTEKLSNNLNDLVYL